MKRMCVFGIVGGVLALQGAVVDAKPLPGAQHNPPAFVDESSTWISTTNSIESYGIEAYAEVVGFGTAPNHARFELRQGSKIVLTIKCSSLPSKVPADGIVTLDCDEKFAKLKGKGAFEADLILHDDSDDKEYLVRTYKLDIRAWDGNQNFQNTADDLAAVSWVRVDTAENTNKRGPQFRFWGTGDWTLTDATLRCKVDGKPLADLEASVQAWKSLGVSVKPTKGEEQNWGWSAVRMTSPYLFGGSNSKRGAPDSKYVWLAEHPGAWDCMIRAKGRNVRELLFTVNSSGGIDSAPMQQGKGAPPLVPNIALIDIRIPKDAVADQRIKPELLKKSMGWGMPWPQHDSVKTILAALPAAFENANPKEPPRPLGKLLAGTEHQPPRFVNEATTQLALTRGSQNDLYRVLLFAQVPGVGTRGDSMRLDWKQNGKVLAVVPCDGDDGGWRCEMKIDGIKATGKIEADLIYVDDQDGNQYKLRTYKVDVVKFKTKGDSIFQIVPDDLLGSAWVRNPSGRDFSDSTDSQPMFYFWVARDGSGGGTLRCTANGTKIDDFNFSYTQTLPGGMDIRAEPFSDTKTLKYAWVQVGVILGANLGARNEYKASDELKAKGRWLIDNPGNWECMMRVESKPVRQFNFIVTDKGTITSALQQAPDASPTLPEVTAIEVRIPKDSKYDERVRPEAIKKSRGFGLPWPNSPAVKAILGSLPPASGLPDPK